MRRFGSVRCKWSIPTYRWDTSVCHHDRMMINSDDEYRKCDLSEDDVCRYEKINKKIAALWTIIVEAYNLARRVTRKIAEENDINF